PEWRNSVGETVKRPSKKKSAVRPAKRAKARRKPVKVQRKPAKATRKSAKPARKPARSKPAKAKRQVRGLWVSGAELARVQERLREAQETLDAIRSGEVDAVVVNGPRGSHIYSLSSVEQPYRVYIERLQEGAVTISADGLILY